MVNDQKRKVIEEYWLKKLSGELRKISLPMITDLKKTIKHEKANYTIQLSDQMTNNLQRISKGSDLALFILALSGLTITLNKYTGITDLVVGSMTPKKGAHPSELLFLRNQISVNLTFKEILNKTKQTVLEAVNYGDYSFETIYNKIKLKSDQNAELDIFNVALYYDQLHDPKDLSLKFDVVFILSSQEEGLSLHVKYNSGLYSEDIIRYFCKNLLHIFENVSAYLDHEISLLEMVSQEEKEKLLELNDTKTEYLKTKTIHQLFEEQVQIKPDDIALIFEETSLTYKELDYKSNQLAYLLRKKGVQADSIIGILVNRSLEMLIGILGVLKAGGAYIPVDPAYPEERIKYMLEDSRAMILLTHGVESNVNKLDFSGEMIDFKKSLNDGNKTKMEDIVTPNNLAYVIYTSGSTGKPKGVMIEHKNVVNFIKGITSKIDFSSNKTILALTTISFDIFFLETIVPLVNGGKVVIANEDQQNNLELLQELLIRHDVNMLQLTPSRLKLLVNNGEDLACFKGIKELMIGGEAFPEHLSTILMNHMQGKIFNLYGPTEATVWSSLQEVVDGQKINIGTPIANTQIYILNEKQKLKPIGVEGELCIAGDGLARGYLNNPELTQEKFIIKDGQRLYRTGDLARWNINGEIEFLGRIDHQVKVRGFRIELGEIENILLSHDDIDEAVVTALENSNGDKSLAVYYISQKVLTISDCREYLTKKLPDYMIPSYFVKIDTMPLTPSGKIDRKALTNPEVQVENKYVVPRDELEEKIVEIWSEILEVDQDQIGIDTNFFELGGHSLSAFQIISKIQKYINVMITIPTFFGSPTIRQLSFAIQKAEKSEFVDLEKVEERGYYPVSYNQRRLWILDQLDPESPAYNLSGRMVLNDQVEEEWIKNALIKIMKRHESFRTKFKTVDGEVVQVIRTDSMELPYQMVDISSFGDVDKQRKREEIFAKVARISFDLAKAPLFTSVLLKWDEEAYDLIFNMHHIISDGWSMEILQREFSYYYEGYRRGEVIDLEPVPYQYKDFAVWHNQQLNNQKIKEKSHQFWKEKLESGLPILELPRDLAWIKRDIDNKQSAGYRCVVNNDTKDRLRKLASENNTTLFMIMFSGFNLLLSYLSGQREVLSGIASAGRDHISLQNIVGYFTNSLVQKTKVDYGESFRELLKRVDRETQETFQHQSYPLELVLDDLKMRFPEISVLFNMLNMIDSANLEGLNSLDSYHIPKVQDGKFELELYVIEYKNGIEINWNYRSSLFKPETMEYIVNEYQKLLTEISIDSAKQINEYNTFALKDIEVRGNLIEPTNSFIKFKGDYQSITERFTEQVAKYPDQIAVKTANQVLTYHELNLLSNQIGRMILDESTSNSNGIAILFEHDAEMIAGIFGVLKSGKYYIPLDPTYPTKRLTYMLKDSDAKIILTNDTNKHLAEKLISEVKNDIKLINVDAIESTISDGKLAIEPGDLAYILYTSGSTGTPKGVIQNHKNVLHFIEVYTNNLHIDSSDRLTLLSSYSFDAAVMDIYGALLNGATLYPYNLKEGDFSSFASWLQDEKITIYHSIPTVYRYFIDELTGKEELSDLRLIVLGGEAVNRRDVEKYKASFSEDCLFINGLGPTESTVTLQYFIDQQTELGNKAVPVGFPVDETEVYLLDENNQEARVFGMGELVFKSDYLALGYLNNLSKTNEVFVTDPITNQGRVYRTGDLGRRLPDGSIEFIGRRDFQVKVRGYRIETGEIEDKLLNHPEIKKAVVMAREAKDGNRYLCAYIVSENEILSSQLRQDLALELPEYMIPSHFIMLDELPLTSSGKVDRKALPEVDFTNTEVEYVAPTNEVEKNLTKIWAEVLDLPAAGIGIDHNFFELGGHSLKATKVISMIHKELSIKVPLVEFFERPTIKNLAVLIAGTEKEVYTSIEVAEKNEYYPLSSAQKRLYILQQMEPKSKSYNISTCVTLEGELDPIRLKKILERLIERHEGLRTSFELVAGEPVQKIHDHVDFEIESYNATEEEVSEVIHHFSRPFDLERAPLLRVGLINIGHAKNILMIEMHHIVSDGTSMGIFVTDLMALYADKELSTLKVQYKDYSVWQQNERVNEKILSQEEYWLNEFANEEEAGTIPVLNIPTDYKRPAVQSFAGDYVTFEIGDHTKALKELALKENTTLYITLLTAFNIFLSKISGQEEIIIGSPIAGRSHPDTLPILGMFVNTLALKNQVQNEQSFRELLHKVNNKTLEAFENQNYQLEDLIEKLDIVRDLSRNPLFDVAFTLQNMDMPEVKIPDLTLRPYPYKKNTSKFDLSLMGVEVGEKLIFTMEYCTKLFKEETIKRFIQYFTRIIDQILENPDQRVADLEIISEAEKKQIINEYNFTKTDYPQNKLMHEIFEEYVQQNPTKTALVFNDHKLTYAELNEKSNQLARVLRDQNVTRDTVVAIMAERSLETFAGILAILKAGGAYLSINSKYPETRKQFMLEDSNAMVVLAQKALAEENKNLLQGKEIILIDDEKTYSGNSSDLPKINKPNDLSYIVYTSGTTGRPKGVMVSHRNVIRLVKNTNYVTFNENDRIGQIGVVEFDASTFEIWGALLNGLALYIIDQETVLDFEHFQERLNQSKITTMFMTTALFNQISQTHIGTFAGLKNLLVGGEALSPTHINSARKSYPKLNLMNVYGPTENTTFSTTFLIDTEYVENIPIGQPIANSTAYIVDKNNKLLPTGIVGELCVGGDGVARGYLNNQKYTEEKFIPNPFKEGDRLYRTGDLARWLPKGTIEFVGRIDDQVKVRGFRIELGEIENKLLQHPEISETVVVVKEREKWDKYLTAYIVSNMEFSQVELREYLAAELPHYMIPSYFVVLEKMPLTRNGKLDRKALPEPDGEIDHRKDYFPPTNDLEKCLAQIWNSILKINQISIYDNFFELGGHSLKATQVISKIYKELNVKMPLAEFFNRPTIKGLAEYIAEVENENYSSIERAEVKEFYPLTSAQKRLYVLQQMGSEHELSSVSYNISAVTILEGNLDIPRFEETFRKLINRHESLRTSFEIVDGNPVQKIHEQVDFKIECYESTETEIRDSKIVESFIRSFNLKMAPLFRVGLVKLSELKHLLILDMHHIISDGTSMGIFIKEFMALYSGDHLPNLKVQYKDVAEWQARKKGIEEMQRQESFWLNEFADEAENGEISPLNLPTSYKRSTIKSFEGSLFTFDIEAQGLRDLSINENVTMYMTLLAICNIFLAKISSQEEIIVGTPVAGRNHPDLEGMIGMFVNTLAIKTSPQGEKRFIDFLKEVKEKTIKVFENQEFQLEDLIEKLDVTRDLSRNPLFDVIFALQNMDMPEVVVPGLKLKPYPYEKKIAKFDLSLIGVEIGDKLNFTLEYCTKLFAQEKIEQFIQYFRKIVAAILENPQVKISDIEILSEAEKNQILYEFNATKREYPKDKTIQEIFEEKVKQNPDQIALVFGEQQLTYLELNKKANHIARVLIAKGIKRDDIITIMAERSIEVFVCILAIIKAGGAYLSIDPKYPETRKKYILEDSKTKIVLVQNDLVVENQDLLHAKDILLLDDLMNVTGDDSNLPEINKPTDLAYIIYTSGTTGRPKGVMVNHQNVIRLVKNTNFVDFNQEDRIAQMGVLEFDTSTVEIWGALLNGLQLHIISKDIVLNFEKLERIFKQSKITTISTTTALVNQISETNIDLFAELKNIIIGGEALSPAHINRIRNEFPKLNIINAYGPTENTTISTTMLIKKDYVDRIPIGRPIANSTAYVVDQYNKLLPIGIVGELCVGGDGVARGYLNDPNLTMEKFIPNPFAEGENLYRTGDLVKWLPDGTIDFLGRIDDQVKIRGFRIELGEIENKLLDYPSVREAVVTVRKTDQGDKYLAAYIVSTPEISLEDLRVFLSEELPHYMVPSYVITIDQMPHTRNGKINRRALPEPDGEVYFGTDYLPPTNETEERLVELWRTILGVEKIGIRDNFFEQGGHSLKATTLMTKVHKEFGVEMPLQEIFSNPTIEKMSDYISNVAGTLEENEQYIPKVEEREYYPLSSMQKNLFIFNQKVDQTIAYNMPGVYIVNGKLEKERFEETIQKLVRRHESLRTSFKFMKGEPVQIIHQDLDVEIQYLKAKDCEVENIVKEFIKPFNLDQAPLFRVGLVETEDQQILLYDLHHIISDGVSSTILISDFAKIYQGESLTDLRIQYKDYALWQKEQLEAGIIKEQEKYWLTTFAEPVSPLDLPADYQRPSVPSFAGDAVHFNLSIETTEKIEELAAKLGATPYMVILAIYNIFLLKYTNTEDVVIGTPIAGRVHEDLKKIIGVFINTLALRNYPKEDKKIIDFVNEVKQNTLSAFDHQGYQYEMLLNALDITPDLSRSPLFDVMFVYLNIEQAEETIKDLHFIPYQFENTAAKYDLTLYGQKNQFENIISLTFRYRTQLFKKETIQKLSERFIKIAEEVVNDWERKISEIEGISKEEKQELLLNFTDDLEDEW